jgi:hypothetical protein
MEKPRHYYSSIQLSQTARKVLDRKRRKGESYEKYLHRIGVV